MKKKTLRFLFALACSSLLMSCGHTDGGPSTSAQLASSSSEATTSIVSSSSTSAQTSADLYYSKVDLTQTGDTLRGALATFLNEKAYSQPSYDTLKTTLPKSDLDPNGSGYMLGFYDQAKLVAKWDSALTWNREHVWPNSRGVGESGPGSDPHMIRPASVSTNSGRGNLFYGLSSDGSCFDPGNSVEKYRGIAARIIFYTATRYWKTNGLELSDNPNDATSAHTMGKLSRLLAWNKAYPVDKTETYRNEVLYKLYNVRNPFIDHPELATSIWGA
jgi:endonuclease I